MRSRYSAYALRLEAYLRATWAPETLPAEALCAEPAPKWIGLDVTRHEVTGTDSAVVEFVARCRIGGRAVRMHEISRFRREDGRWLYIDGEQR